MARCNPFIFFESPDKIAEIVESVAVSDLRNGVVCGGQLIAGFFDPLMIEIFHGRLVRHLRKKTAEVFRRHGNRSGKLLKRQRGGIIMLNKL